MDSFLSSCQGNLSIVDPPLSVQSIPDSVPANVKLLLQKLPTILCSGDVVPNPSHGMEHHVHTGRHPTVFAKACSLNPEKLEIAKVEFKHLESSSIVRCSTSPWVFPLHMIPIKDGSWRPCGDYCRLNLITTSNEYLLPNMQILQMAFMVTQFFQN